MIHVLNEKTVVDLANEIGLERNCFGYVEAVSKCKERNIYCLESDEVKDKLIKLYRCIY